MANHPTDGPSDDFFEQILGFPAAPYGGGPDANLGGTALQAPMMLQLSSGSTDGSSAHLGVGLGLGGGGAPPFHGGFPLGLSLDHGGEVSSGGLNMFRNDVVDSMASSSSPNLKSGFRGKAIPSMVHAPPHPPAMRPRVRARRGQATDPHSIAERLRRERIAERIRALQELVPSVNKTDRAAMLDEILDYVKFLRLQVKVLSMSRLGGAGAVAPLVTDFPRTTTPVEEEDSNEGGRSQGEWGKWSSDGTERQVAKLMDEDVGAAMQFLQSKALCIMPISLASAIYQAPPQDETNPLVHQETNPPI